MYCYLDLFIFEQLRYSLLKKKLEDLPRYTLLHCDPKNEKYKNFLSELFGEHIYFCEDLASVQKAVSSLPAPYITMGDYLTLAAMTLTDKQILPVSVCQSNNLAIPPFFELDLQKKAETTVQAMFDAMARNVIDHDLRIEY